jgi:predicted metal-binding protein
MRLEMGGIGVGRPVLETFIQTPALPASIFPMRTIHLQSLQVTAHVIEIAACRTQTKPSQKIRKIARIKDFSSNVVISILFVSDAHSLYWKGTASFLVRLTKINDLKKGV